MLSSTTISKALLFGLSLVRFGFWASMAFMTTWAYVLAMRSDVAKAMASTWHQYRFGGTGREA
jgi:hypothetical protein